MANEILYIKKEREPNNTALKEIFDHYIEDTITSEQIRRVLEPVLKMIREGKFDRPRRIQYGWLMRPLGSFAAIGILILIVSMVG